MRIITTMPNNYNELARKFHDHLAMKDLSTTTIKSYLHDIKIFRDWLYWVYDSHIVLPLTEVSLTDLASFRKYLIHEKGQKPSTINRRIQSLRIFFDWLFQEKYIPDDPAKELRFMRKTSRQKPNTLTKSEILSLLRSATNPSHGMEKRNYAIVQLMFQTGIRISELCALKHRDLKISKRSGQVCVREGKGLKQRDIPLNTTVRRALTGYLETLEEVSDDQYVFKSKRGTPLSIRGTQKLIATIAKSANITRIQVSSHIFRHTFATNYLKNNPGKIVELASLMGHDSLNTTAIYTRPSKEDLSEDLERSPLNVFGE